MLNIITNVIHDIDRYWSKLKCELMEQKMGLMTDREELQKKTQEQKQLQQKFDELHAEVKELRKLQVEVRSGPKGKGSGGGSTVAR